MKSTIDSASRVKDYASSKFSLLKTQPLHGETFNTVSQLPKHVRQTIISDGEILVNSPKWCEEIWKTMRKNDFATQGALNLPIVENIYNAHERKFEKMMGCESAQELFEMMDADTDGSINEDEQILIFSVIKEKMLKVAESLCSIQEYARYRDLMKAVRKLESQIGKYQDFLRNRIYKGEVEIYHQIGEARFDDFYAHYEEQFKELNTYSLDRETQMRAQHEDQMNNLLDRLDRAVEAAKFKPKSQLKDYQTQEKLVSIDERVEEAMNFRRELKNLEVSEAQRINKLRIANIEKQQKELEAEQRKELTHLQSKMKNEENKLIIKLKADFEVLNKKNHLHENEIKKIQGLAAKFAMQKALGDGELRRMKEKSRKLNDILISAKMSSTAGFGTNASPNTQMGSTMEKFGRGTSMHMGSITLTSTDVPNRNTEFVKSLLKSPNLVSFHLKKSYGEEPPVNAKPVNYANEDKLSHKKVEIYLNNKPEKKQQIPNLTSLYDNELKPIERSMERVEKLTADEKRRTRQFINEKLNGDRKIAV